MKYFVNAKSQAWLSESPEHEKAESWPEATKTQTTTVVSRFFGSGGFQDLKSVKEEEGCVLIYPMWR